MLMIGQLFGVFSAFPNRKAQDINMENFQQDKKNFFDLSPSSVLYKFCLFLFLNYCITFDLCHSKLVEFMVKGIKKIRFSSVSTSTTCLKLVNISFFSVTAMLFFSQNL